MDKEMLKGNIDILILSFASKKEVYGFEIAKNIKEYSESLYEIGEGTLYPALKRLEERKLLTSYWGEANMGGRRKYYNTTKEGINELNDKLHDWKIINKLIKMSLGEDDLNNE